MPRVPVPNFNVVGETVQVNWMKSLYATITLDEEYQCVVTRTGQSQLLPERQIARWLPTLQGYVNRWKVRNPDRADLLAHFAAQQKEAHGPKRPRK